MIAIILCFLLLSLFVFLFFREVRLDHERYFEQDRLGDEHILREIEKHFREKESKQITAESDDLPHSL